MGCGVGARARMDIREGGKGYFERRFITAISIQLATAVTFAAIGGYIVTQSSLSSKLIELTSTQPRL